MRLTRSVVEVFHDNNRLCSHVRLYGRQGQYSTKNEHMPPNHQQYTQWNGERFLSHPTKSADFAGTPAWAAKIGPNTAAVVEGILTSYKVEQQGYRACMALLKMSDTYTPERLEAACVKALRYTPRPPYKTIQTILKTGQDQLADDSAPPPPPSEHGFTRGADYYRKGAK